jgi:hypothetical protein
MSTKATSTLPWPVAIGLLIGACIIAWHIFIWLFVGAFMLVALFVP